MVTILATAGCVSPPTETADNATGIPSGHSSIDTRTISPTQTPTYVFVTTATPYVKIIDDIGGSEGKTQGYRVYSTPTPNPDERSCRIYSINSKSFMNDGTAFTFNLKNSPMYITYTVVPQNITGYKVYTSRYTTKKDEAVYYDTYDPLSYLEITVRNKTSGEIYLQDGFGIDYALYLSRTLKVLDSDDMLIEIKGDRIKGSVNVWVKPVGNFDNPANMTFDSCTYWPQSVRDVTALALITGTPTPTWATPTATTIPVTTQTPSSTS
jgi:hypothetical protein